MLDAIQQALALSLTWPNPVLILIGTTIGLLFGMVPGLSGAVAIALMIPLTFSMPLDQAMYLLLPALGGSAFGGSLSAILSNVPGSAVNAATTFDGYPLARQGKAGMAIGASAAASALGAVFGLIVLAASIPLLLQIILLIGPPEVFMLTFLGLTVIAFAAEGSMVAALISGGLGLMLSFHGYVGVVGGTRFTFGWPQLWDGIPLVPVFIGLFALGGAIELLLEGRQVAQVPPLAGRLRDSLAAGIAGVFRHVRVFMSSSVIGVLIGIIPGVGGSVSNFLAYTVARQTSKEPESFGQGNLAGVIAPEAANDAKDGGALMPTLALGIPGSEAMAILLGAFLLHGVDPGRAMFTEHLSLVWVLILALFASNLLTSAIGVLFARQLIRLTAVPVNLYAPAIVCLGLIGAYGVDRNLWHPVLALLFGVLGFAMRRYGYSRVALVIGLILGDNVEAAFFQSVQIARGSYAVFWERPISLALFLLILVALLAPFVAAVRRRRG